MKHLMWYFNKTFPRFYMFLQSSYKNNKIEKLFRFSHSRCHAAIKSCVNLENLLCQEYEGREIKRVVKRNSKINFNKLSKILHF